MAKNTCRDCNRNVLLVRVGGELVATDPELISVVTAQSRTYVGDESGSRVVMATKATFARRLHAERCSEYVEAARRDRIAADLRAFNKKNGVAPRKNHGL
jgi:hypothetical protein